MFLPRGEACKDDCSLSPKILSSVCRRNIQRNASTDVPQRDVGRRGGRGQGGKSGEEREFWMLKKLNCLLSLHVCCHIISKRKCFPKGTIHVFLYTVHTQAVTRPPLTWREHLASP